MSFQTSAAGSSYRPDIDGLRAIAVLAVLGGHAFDHFLPGGYLGVDVFFVISGFVIALSLLGRKESAFSSYIFGFYLRRFKRLMPALLVCFSITCIVLLFIDTSPKVSLITGALALFGFSNFYLYDQKLDYFSASTEYNAFTHTWSLGVEEQFYFIFPFVFWLVFRFTKGHSATILGLLITALSLASLISFLALQAGSPIFAYYMMPTRFWEIGAGVVVACLVHRGVMLPLALTGVLAHTVYLLTLGAVFLLLPGTFIYGHVVAAAMSVLLIWSGASALNTNRLLTNALSIYIGRISYSLYLWHWPFLVFGLLSIDTWVASPVLAMVAALGAAILSYHFVEQPVRRCLTPVPKFRHFALTFSSIFGAIIIIASANEYRKGLPKAPFEEALRPAFVNLPSSDMTFNPHCVVTPHEPALQLKPDTFDKCTYASLPGGDSRTIWVLGDSHAGHLQGGLVKLHREEGFGLHLVETPGQAFPSTFEEGFTERNALMEHVRANWKAGDVVVLGRLLLSRTETPAAYNDLQDWFVEIDDLANELDQVGVKLVILGPPPMFQFEDIRACDPQNVLSCSIPRGPQRKVIEGIIRDMKTLEADHANVAVLDLFDVFCPATAPVCSPLRKGVFTFRDRDHLNVYGAELLMPHFQIALSVFEN